MFAPDHMLRPLETALHHRGHPYMSPDLWRGHARKERHAATNGEADRPPSFLQGPGAQPGGSHPEPCAPILQTV